MSRFEKAHALRQLSFDDFSLFETVARQGSLAAAARELDLRSPYVTKAIQRIESLLHVTLLKRTSLGISLTQEGTEFLNLCKKMIETLEQTQWGAPRDHVAIRYPLITAVGPMFLLAHLAGPHIARAFKGEERGIRLVDMTGSQMLTASAQEHFDIALHCDDLSWSRSWQSFPIGTIEWVLCARAGHPLRARTSEKEVLRFPFILPALISSQGHRTGDDYCPAPIKQRSRFSEVSSGEIGLRALESSDELIFLPEIQVKDFVSQGKLRVIDVKDWAPVRKTAYLTVHQDRLTQKQVRALLQALESGLKKRPAEPAAPRVE